MILELLLTPILSIVDWAFGWININQLNLPTWIDDTLNLVAKAMMFFPTDVWVIVIANVAFWMTIQFTWAIIEWIYKKIPGVS